MELLDRYLQAVKRHLPWERQDDIIAELRANLEAQLEDKEAEMGRPLTKEEAEAWLKQIGSPIQVAARYQRQQYLIGPAVFPTYWFVLRLAITWGAIIYSIAKAVDIAAHGLGAEAIVSAVIYLPWVLLINAAIVTLVFAAIEQVGVRYPGKCVPFAPMAPAWSPSGLPPMGVDEANKPRSFAKASAEVIFGFLFLGWLLLVPHYPYLMFGPGAWYLRLPYQLAPVWLSFYWCLVGINIFELTWKIVDLARGAWQRPKSRAKHLSMHTLSLIPLSVLLAAPDHMLFLLKKPEDAVTLGGALASANKGVHLALTIALAIVVLQLVWGAGKMGVEAWRNRVAAMR
ncbi:putative membrane protein [Candidatus Sulfotelmatomonas gaucii]|uniref:Putative membrane protein n=1 Tax=Candidatus Sulfuritelmatomonas gaucii TaxID=2043161 RepID=A0A2N9L647_9BACT|nr:putative membrane protein [Candidatus Sulfotelmatomonas gaucii]